MKQLYRIILSLFFYGIFFPLAGEDTYAVITIPVVNATGHRLGTEEDYEKLPYANSPDGKIECERLHQLLFNEMVRIIQVHQHEIEGELLNCTFTSQKNSRQGTVFIPKKAILYKNSLSDDMCTALPTPYEIGKNNNHKNIVTLTHPLPLDEYCLVFSAGTRFVRVPEEDTETSYAALINDYEKKTPLTVLIPKTHALIKATQDQQQCRKLFISLLKEWAHQEIPIKYVWGGNSFFPEKEGVGPCAGFDCSGLILRAAQICHMPYFWKNTATIKEHLQPLTKNDTIKPGDLIWYPGHVLIVSNIEKHTAIEAKGYDSGHGVIHELPLSSIFDSIHTYQDLLNAYQKNIKVIRLDKKGKPVKSVPFTLFSFDSVWK